MLDDERWPPIPCMGIHSAHEIRRATGGRIKKCGFLLVTSVFFWGIKPDCLYLPHTRILPDVFFMWRCSCKSVLPILAIPFIYVAPGFYRTCFFMWRCSYKFVLPILAIPFIYAAPVFYRTCFFTWVRSCETVLPILEIPFIYAAPGFYRTCFFCISMIY